MFYILKRLAFYGALFCNAKKKDIYVDDNAPNYVPKLLFKNLPDSLSKKVKYIIKSKVTSEILYTMLCDKNNNDPMEITQYLYDRYTHLQAGEKAILYTILQLANDPSKKNVITDLQHKMDMAYTNSHYSWLGTFLLSLYFLMDLSDKPFENYEAIQEAVKCLSLADEEIFNRNGRYNALLFFIAQYYLCDFFLNMIVYAFKSKRYNEVIIYAKKIILRHKIHPLAAIEALFYLLEVMLILDFQELGLYYKSVIDQHIKNNPLLQKRKYDLRLVYLLQIYKFSK